MEPENITLFSIQPLCNCENPELRSTCDFAEHKGVRFYLTASAHKGFEAVHDRHGDRLLGTVSITLSVEFLTLVREKYGHQ